MKEYNKETITKLLKDFYELVNFKTCIYDAAGNEVCSYPYKYNDFCKRLRTNKEYENRCRLCDKNALEYCNKSKEQYSYICHAGLFECVSPILYENEVVGYIVAGQIRLKDSKILIHDNEIYKEDFYKLPAIEEKKIFSAMNILKACTGFEYLKSVIQSLNNTIEGNIELFIVNELDKELKVEFLCQKWHLSRNELYQIFSNSFACTPGEYIKQKRIEKACELLKNTHLKVSEICVKVGIVDYNYFSKVFKKEMKCSPREYRKEK